MVDYFNYSALRASTAPDFTVTISGTPQVIIGLPSDSVPDGITFVAPAPFLGSNEWLFVLAEQDNLVATSTKARDYSSLSPSNWFKPKGLGGSDNPLPWDTKHHFGSAWIFAILPALVSPQFLIGFLHLENHIYGQAPPTWKSLGVSYSHDKGQTWSTPQQIVTSPPYTDAFANQWSGSGDPCFLYDYKLREWRAYFFSAQVPQGFGIARSRDPTAAPGSWQVYMGNGKFADALTSTTFHAGPLVGGNPQVIWSKSLKCWLMSVTEWGHAGTVSFAVSVDGYEWTNIKRITLASDLAQSGFPTYPSLVSSEGGSLWMEEQATLYYANFTGFGSTGKRLMMSRKLTISPVPIPQILIE
jgi:hypothetical protein